ncbi:unnamed protein product [Fraxinus pennsylvanica]|uniref:Uncharacterized protein n=1 Tax=Fraxinus pennsylvanica TaxID=56036 RepID=A0AAD1Z3C7_9LAMI|nr:unnamed protein product [Fraxinus pennsylvanica]
MEKKKVDEHEAGSVALLKVDRFGFAKLEANSPDGLTRSKSAFEYGRYANYKMHAHSRRDCLDFVHGGTSVPPYWCSASLPPCTRTEGGMGLWGSLAYGLGRSLASEGRWPRESS